MSTFVAVPAADLQNFLQAKGYTPTTQHNEIVFIKRSQVDPNLMIKVYTSISVGQATVRAVGRDAMRVCVVWDDSRRSFGVGKFPPVFRTHSVQSVLDRLNIRLSEAVQRAKEWLQEQADKRQREQDLRDKAAFAKREQEQEAQASMNDPDMRNDGPAFEAYAATLEVPF